MLKEVLLLILALLIMALVYGLFEKIELFIENIYETWKLGKDVKTGKYSGGVVLRKATIEEKEEYTKNKKLDNVWVVEDSSRKLSAEEKYLNFLSKNSKKLPPRNQRW